MYALKRKDVVVARDRECSTCGTYRAIGETMTYVVYVYGGEFFTEYHCFICPNGRGQQR